MHTLAEAFANLERAQRVERVWRHSRRNLLGARVSVLPEEGEGYWEFTRIREEMFVLVENFTYKDPRLEIVPGDGMIQFNYRLSGDLTLGVSRTEPLRLNRPSFLIWTQAPGCDIAEWTAPSAYERCVAISVHPEYFIDNFLTSATDAPEQLKAFITSRGQINFCQTPLSSSMYELATKLVGNPYSGSLALVYTESLAMELLCSTVAMFDSLPSAPHQQYTARELSCLHAARSLLMKRFSPVPTIRQLAHAVGMNETTLKRGFKASFGETLYQFSVRCRMQHALTLLRDRQLSIAKVAELVGYNHHTSFATAFLRHFGIRPKDVRQSKIP